MWKYLTNLTNETIDNARETINAIQGFAVETIDDANLMFGEAINGIEDWAFAPSPDDLDREQKELGKKIDEEVELYAKQNQIPRAREDLKNIDRLYGKDNKIPFALEASTNMNSNGSSTSIATQKIPSTEERKAIAKAANNTTYALKALQEAANFGNQNLNTNSSISTSSSIQQVNSASFKDLDEVTQREESSKKTTGCSVATVAAKIIKESLNTRNELLKSSGTFDFRR